MFEEKHYAFRVSFQNPLVKKITCIGVNHLENKRFNNIDETSKKHSRRLEYSINF